MSEMVERVARAIMSARGVNSEYVGTRGVIAEAADNPHCATAVRQARAAIAAMREPTKKMTEVGFNYALSTSIGGGYRWPHYIAEKHRLMIDAALAEDGEAT